MNERFLLKTSVAGLAAAFLGVPLASAGCASQSSTAEPATQPESSATTVNQEATTQSQVAATSSPSSEQPRDHSAALELPSLSAKMKEYFSVGAAIEPVQLSEVGDILVHHFDRLTAENAMKLGPLCKTPECDFSDADKIAEFARKNDMKMTGHAFVWHRMYPAWYFKDGNQAASRDLVSERLHDHIFTMTERYADVVDNWDVVNEAISDAKDKTYRDGDEGSKWYTAFEGKEYIKAAFEHAAAAAEEHDPDVKLYYNDYNVVKADKRKKIIEMVNWLREEGVRVDGVGLQAHWNLEWPPAADIRAAIDELSAQDLDVKISELDVSIYTKDDHGNEEWQPEIEFTPELQNKLTARYEEIFEIFLEKSDVLDQVTLWGVSDDRTWLNYWPAQRENHPLLFDREHQPKPALSAIIEAADEASSGDGESAGAN